MMAEPYGGLQFISADDIDSLLTFPDLIAGLSAAFVDSAEPPLRHHYAIGGAEGQAIHLLMPAWTRDAPGAGQFLGTKIVNVFPANRSHGLPAVLGVYVLQSGETGAPLAILDGTRLTHWRTAAASALAATFLAGRDARRLLMVGTGALAPFLVRAHASVRPIEHVSVWNHRLAGAEALALELREAGFAADAALDLEAATAGADVISCATLSNEPLIRGDWLRPGVHLDLVGAFSLAMREADDAALLRAKLYVDTPAALHEGGDVAVAIRGGAIGPDHVRATLHDLCRGTSPGRESLDDVTVFKSVGTAIEDLAAAMLVWRRRHSGSADATPARR